MDDGKRSCDVAAPVKKASAPVAKAVKTRDRGTQTLKVSDKPKRPASQEMAVKDRSRDKSPAAAAAAAKTQTSPTKRPAGSQQVSQKRPRLEASPAKKESTFGSAVQPSKRVKTATDQSAMDGITVIQKSPKKASA